MSLSTLAEPAAAVISHRRRRPLSEISFSSAEGMQLERAAFQSAVDIRTDSSPREVKQALLEQCQAVRSAILAFRDATVAARRIRVRRGLSSPSTDVLRQDRFLAAAILGATIVADNEGTPRWATTSIVCLCAAVFCCVIEPAHIVPQAVLLGPLISLGSLYGAAH